MAELLQQISVRRARRALAERPVPEEVLSRIMTAATLAPSCFNNQPWRFVVVNREPELSAVKAHLSGGNYWARLAPCIIPVFTTPELDCRLSEGRDYALFSTGLAVENLVLQATAEGLIAHPIAGYSPGPVKEALGIPGEMILITLVVLGLPGDPAALSDKHRERERAPRSRKPMAEVVRFGRWGEPGRGEGERGDA